MTMSREMWRPFYEHLHELARRTRDHADRADAIQNEVLRFLEHQRPLEELHRAGVSWRLIDGKRVTRRLWRLGESMARTALEDAEDG